MGTSLSHISEARLLETLGDGDWLLALPKGYPDLCISPVWRQELIETTACQSVRWAMNGITIGITYDYDPPWDHSGIAQRYATHPHELLARYELLEDWLTNEYTGNRHPTFTSGYGWYWHTYADELQEDISWQVNKLIEEQLGPVGDPDDDAAWDALWDDISDVQFPLERALQLLAGKMTTEEAWRRFKATVKAQQEGEKRQAAERAALYAVWRDRAHTFWRSNFADLAEQRIEKPQFKALQLDGRLTELLADTDPQIVEAIAAIGLPSNFSNPVVEIVKQIAQHALNDNRMSNQGG